MLEDRPIITERRVFDKVRVGYTFRESLEFNSELRVDPETFQKELYHSVEGFVLEEKLAKEVYRDTAYNQIPTSSWQMFKDEHQDSWWLGWLVRRRPVLCREQRFDLEVRIDRRNRYPEANVTTTPLGRPYIFDTVDTSLNTFRNG